jgi:hypothetical protein
MVIVKDSIHPLLCCGRRPRFAGCGSDATEILRALQEFFPAHLATSVPEPHFLEGTVGTGDRRGRPAGWKQPRSSGRHSEDGPDREPDQRQQEQEGHETPDPPPPVMPDETITMIGQ